jgi:hypothetical protein
MRARADGNSFNNDSVWMQFSNSVNGSGTPAWRIGTTSGMFVALEECSGCGVQGWGWHDNGSGRGVRGAPIFFASTGTTTIRVQQREDGISIDQIVLSPSTYKSSSPGKLKNDTVILAEAGRVASGTTPSGINEIVMHVRDVSKVVGKWNRTADSTAANGIRLWNPNAGVPRPSSARATPTSYFEKTFRADAGKAYHLWLRMKAENNSWSNDSVWVQFSTSRNAAGTAVWRIGTSGAAEVSLEEGNGQGMQGWGWNDNAYGSLAAPIYFATGGTQTIRVQSREDGISIDQIVLSAVRNLTTRPGALKNDKTIVPATVGP